MSIQKRTYARKGKGGKQVKRTVWRVRWIDHDGSHRSKQFDAYSDAMAFDGRAKAGASIPFVLQSAKFATLAELWDEWFPIYRATVAKNTAEGYEYCWSAHLEPNLGSRSLADFMTAFPVQELHAALARGKVGNSTIRKSIMLLKMMLDAAVSYRVLPYNGARTYQLGRKASAKRKRPLVMISAPRVERMRAALLSRTHTGAPGLTASEHNLRTVALLTLLSYAGLRPAEALALKWKDIDRVNRELCAGKRVANGDDADPKTPNSIRRIPIIAPLLQDLNAWHEVTPYNGADDPIIPSHDGLPWGTQALRNWARLIFSPAANVEGLARVRPYDLRHTWCMSQIRCGWDLVYLAERAGSSAETIATYYLAEPALQRDLEIPDGVDFETWVKRQRRNASGVRLAVVS